MDTAPDSAPTAWDMRVVSYFGLLLGVWLSSYFVFPRLVNNWSKLVAITSMVAVLASYLVYIKLPFDTKFYTVVLLSCMVLLKTNQVVFFVMPNHPAGVTTNPKKLLTFSRLLLLELFVRVLVLCVPSKPCLPSWQNWHLRDDQLFCLHAFLCCIEGHRGVLVFCLLHHVPWWSWRRCYLQELDFLDLVYNYVDVLFGSFYLALGHFTLFGEPLQFGEI